MAKNMAVVEGSVVTNIIWVSSNTQPSWQWVDVGDYPVAIGDTYDGSRFYRDGELILSPLETAQRELQEQEQAHLDELADLISEIYAEDDEVIEE